MNDDFEMLKPIVAAMRDRALETHRASVAREDHLARELGEIDALRDAARDAQADITTHRLTGADTLWHGWLLKRRIGLLQEAALARSDAIVSGDAARLALGRSDAIDGLAKRARTEAHHRAEKGRLGTLQSLAMFQSVVTESSP